MSKKVSNVISWIDDHEEDIINFLMDYIRFKSPTGKEEKVHKEFIYPFLKDEMDWDNVKIVDVSDKRNRPNINATLKGSGNGKTLLFNGHSDVVDVTKKGREKWNTNPWEPVIKEDKLYGRGSNDMKGGNTAFIWAVKSIMESGIELNGDLLLSTVVGEELNEQKLGTIAATEEFLGRGKDIDFCVNAEPTSNEIHTKGAGTFDFRISIPGKAVHTSQKNLLQYPQRYGVPVGSEVGVNPVPIMADVLDKMTHLENQWNMRYRDKVYGSGGYPAAMDMQGVGPVAICSTLITAGEYIASIPDNATAKGQIYYPPFVDANDLRKEVEQAVSSLEHTYDWLKENPISVNWKEQFDWPPYEVPVDHEGCQALGNAFTEATKRDPVYSGFKAVNDDAYIQTEFGIPTVSLGPGDLFMGTHGANEYVPIRQVIEATKVYTAMVLNWCGSLD